MKFWHITANVEGEIDVLLQAKTQAAAEKHVQHMIPGSCYIFNIVEVTEAGVREQVNDNLFREGGLGVFVIPS